MARETLKVTVKNIYEYKDAKFGGYGVETHYIYTFVGEDETVYVWKTTAFAGMEVEDAQDGWIIKEKNGKKVLYRFDAINKGDAIKIAATISGDVTEYRGQVQVVVKRVKVLERTFKAKTYEEIVAEREAERQAKKQAQIESVQGGDFIWTMPYKQYKDHYADCETIAGSFQRVNGRCTIDVIIREGRLKASGTRGEHFSGYEFHVVEDGVKYRTVYRAVSEENALKRLKKDYPNATEIKCGKIYDYQR